METRFLIIDGNSLACRAAFAHNPNFGPDLQTKDGKVTGGIFRFFTMFDKILKQIRPTHVIVGWDVNRHNWRKQVYPLYKANREKKEESLFIQFEDIKNILNAIGIKNIGVIGYEGDDIVGTYVSKSKATKNFIVSGDKDCYQLVNDNTSIVFPKVGFSEIELITPEYILNKYDIPVEQFVDLKALMGDAGDNVPGIDGCGEKTAIKLLKHYGSAKEVSNNKDNIDIKGVNKKVKAGIQEWSKQSDLIIDLVTIRKDIPEQFLFDYDSCYIGNEINWDGAYQLFKELEFNALINKMHEGGLYGYKSVF